MNRFALLVLLATHSIASSATFAADAKPNFVIIFIDDLGYADIGPFGATKQKTPNLDRMAREGMKLTSFYAAPVCSVSRAQLMTGCYGARISVPGVYFPGNAAGLNPQETTIAEQLKKQGYATMCIGKWHLGDQPEFLPTKQGFDHYFGIPYSNDMQRVAKETGQRVVPLVRDDKVAELLTDEDQRQVTERYTDEAVKFIRDHRDEPFFLYLPHTAVHTPIYPGAAFRGKSTNGRFGDWVEEVDWSVGRVLDTLRELKLDQNTLVVFTSDNGPWLIKGPTAAAPCRCAAAREARGKAACACRRSRGGPDGSRPTASATQSPARSTCCRRSSRWQAEPFPPSRSSTVATSAACCSARRANLPARRTTTSPATTCRPCDKDLGSWRLLRSPKRWAKA